MRKKIIIILMMALLAGVVAASQMLGERLYAQVDESTENEESDQQEGEETTENVTSDEGADASIETIGNTENGTQAKTEKQKSENRNQEEKNKNENAEGALVVLDAGHGGFDPGKIGINGALEKDVNLVVAQKVKKSLEEMGVRVIMTRENGGELADSKVEDLKARVALINDNTPSIAVSIHQNSYSQESIHGAQVFYYTHSKNGEQAAKILQEAMLEVDPDNNRQAKANDTYYLLKKTKETTVIVECGFLSNQKEADLLISDEYQEKMAAAIAKGIQEYLSSFTL